MDPLRAPRDLSDTAPLVGHLPDSPRNQVVRAAQTSKLRTTVVEAEGIQALRDAWIGLLPAERWSFFQHPDWCRLVWETYFPSAKLQLQLAFDGERLVGMLPTCRRRMNRFGLFLPVVEAFAGGRGDYSAPLTAEGAGPEVSAALLDSALAASRRSGVFVLANLPDANGLPDAIEEHLRSRGLTFVRTDAECFRQEFGPGLTDADLALNPKRRNDIRRCQKRIEEERGPVVFRVVDTPDEAKRLLPAFFEMHDRRWLDAGRPGSFGDAAARESYYRLVSELWDEGVHVSVVTCGDTPISFHIGMVRHGHLLYFKPTFDPGLSRFSPGRIHLRFLLQHALDTGLAGIDLLQGAEGYKAEWANTATSTSTFIVRTSSRTPSYFWITKGRGWAERNLGRAYTRMATLTQRFRRSMAKGADAAGNAE